MERDDVFRLEKNFFKKPANYAVIVMALLIANNGIAYYPYFTCFILLVTGVSKWLKTKKPAGFLKSLSMVGLICVFLVLALLPAEIYTLVNGGNTEAVDRAGFLETEMYGLKLIMLFMPRNSHGIELFEKVITEYDLNTTYLNENITEYLGIIAIIGFFVLMFSLFINRESVINKRLAMLSEINIMLIILGTTSGLGTIIAFLITDKIRGYNRISIFIECGCILGIALLCDYWVKKKKRDNRKIAAVAITVVTGIVCVFSIWEGCQRVSAETYSVYQAEFDSDENFVSDIESSVAEGSMIYQLPYHKYPEGEAANNMWDYHLFIGFLHSDSLKWSYGSIKGREGDEWNEAVSEMDYSSMVSYLKEQGFAGIYIDRRAYTSDEINVLESELKEIIGHAPSMSGNGNLSFFKF
jgi:hypothetical protein